jgi:hypothetical protein
LPLIRLLPLLFIIGCAKESLSETPDDVLAKVGNRIITSKDFLQRTK